MCISDNPVHTMKGIQSEFKVKDEKMEKPYIYLGAELSTIENKQGDKIWAMSYDKSCAAMVKNVRETLSNKGLRIPTKCDIPTKQGYRQEMECTGELKAHGL